MPGKVWILRDYVSLIEFERGSFAECAVRKELLRQQGFHAADDLEIVQIRVRKPVPVDQDTRLASRS